MTTQRRTLVSFHAHPDDETLLTGGTLAGAAALGHRVVLVVATAGEQGLAAGVPPTDLGHRRHDELRRAADELGCARVEVLGYADSGRDGRQGGAAGFSRTPVGPAAARVADILREERADALTVYDAAGGYGHPDHVAVYRVGTRAAALAGTPVVLEATVDRALVLRAARVLAWAGPYAPRVPWAKGDTVFTAADQITHRVDVRDHLDAKRRALAAHASQATADGEVRGLAWAMRLPRPVFGAVFGREWFVVRDRDPAGRAADIFPFA